MGSSKPGTLNMKKKLLAQTVCVFQGLGKLRGEYTIRIDKNVTPVKNCRDVPFNLREQLKQKLDMMVKQGIISKVEEPTDWISSFVIAPKKNGDGRICLAPQDLNSAIKRLHYKLATREEIMGSFAVANVFSKLDASQGFYQIKLSEESSYLTPCITRFGHYRYLCMPFGISSAPEAYHQQINEMFHARDS